MLQYNRRHSPDVSTPLKVDQDREGQQPSYAAADSALVNSNLFSFDLLLTTLEGLGYGGVLLDRSGAVLDFNPTAAKILECETNGLSARTEQWGLVKGAVTSLLSHYNANPGQPEKSWSTALRKTGRPLALMQLADKVDTGNTLIILVDLDYALQPNPQALKQLFGLTAAEMKLAQRLALGIAPAELASELHLSRNTIRTQIASIMAKTHTKRQPELVALLARVSILPHLGG